MGEEATDIYLVYDKIDKSLLKKIRKTYKKYARSMGSKNDNFDTQYPSGKCLLSDVIFDFIQINGPLAKRMVALLNECLKPKVGLFKRLKLFRKSR